MDDLERLLLPVDEGLFALPEGDILVLNARAGPGLARLPRARLRCEQGFRPDHDALAALGIDVLPARDGPAAAAFVLLARSRTASLGLVARALRALPPGGLLLVSGTKTDGAEGIAKTLRTALPVEGVLSKAHGKVLWLARPDPLPPEVAGWEAAARPRPNPAGFLTAPGMFSEAHPDPGSQALAARLAGALSGRVADLGAGWGWLAHAALAANPGIADLLLVEADHAALEAARANVADPRARFLWADATTLSARDGPFDHVVTNPPFHQGRAAEPALGEAFLAAAARLLGREGRLHLVANRQLPYEAPLARLFAEVSAEPAEGGYKLIRAARPKPPARPPRPPPPAPRRRSR